MADNSDLIFSPITVDPILITDAYLDKSDWRIKENSTSQYNIGGLILHQAGTITANYWLSKVYRSEIANAHKNCDFHIHDLNFLAGYCSGWSIAEILEEGVGGVRGKINSGPPKHLSTAVQQLVNFLGILQNEFAGAQALNGFDTYLAPFIRKDNMKLEDVRQCLQFFCFSINVPSRWGGQAPFSNVTLDLMVPKDLQDKHPIIGGKKQSFVYGDLQPEINMFNKAFFEVFEAGDFKGNIFQYPIPTVNCTTDFFEKMDPEVEERLYRLTAKFGLFYFSNFINSDMSPEDARSMCCRLRLDLRQLTRKNGSLFGSGDNTGSIGVVTLNLPKLGYLSHTKEELFSRIEALMILAKTSLEQKRIHISDWFDKGLYQYAKRYLKAKFDNHFSTIGLVGMNELCRNYFRNVKKKDWDISTREGKALTIEILNFMRTKCSDFQEETGHLYNLESTPAESTAYRLAMHDKKTYPDIITSGTITNPYYTNSTNLPVNFSDDVWEAIKHQEDLQKLYTGGTTFHTYLNESVDDPQKVKDFIKKVMYNTTLPYLTLTPTFSHCEIHGFIKGNVNGVCPKCKEEAIAGYQTRLTELEEKKEKLLREAEQNQCCSTEN
jgi:ribonucleoside-triphosphate reductase